MRSQPIGQPNKPTRIIRTKKIAIFGARCFWGVKAAFCKVSGVVSTSVGYIAG
ncbi:peptide-methionine (S)-S-oxide reductase [Leptolyngbya ohadii]|uniref:peptide-methionine (S)-S-oxide reductase n=1 Tax=Leptolyngbya ohadii TaxID=1962290 RepID=UPI0034E2F6AC